MKTIFKISGLLFIAMTLNISTTSDLPATTYVCQEGGCTTTINEYDGGYNWSILCDDGSHDSGNSPGATYQGLCPQIPE